MQTLAARSVHPMPTRYDDGRPRRLAVVSTYPPRPCGIATFTRDLRDGLAAADPDLDVVVCAMDRDGLRYGSEVAVVLDQDDREDHRRAAERLAAQGVDAVLIQHEFGIFGGPDGAWINDFAAAVTAAGIPYLVTLHTVLSQPSPGQADALRRLCAGAAAVTVFTATARRLAVETGVASAERIHIVPHGAPALLGAHLPGRAAADRPAVEEQLRPEVAATLERLRGATVVSTFGLISPNKGLHSAITAVAELAPELPDLHYVIAGATHPEVARHHGEDYRDSLLRQANELGVSDRVHFVDMFLTDAEIAALLRQTDLFLTPYGSAEQISSGALTFALAAGVPALSTAYHFARDMLGDGAGRTVPPGDVRAFTAALRALLTEPGALSQATAAARAVSDRLPWPVVAARFADIIRDNSRKPRVAERVDRAERAERVAERIVKPVTAQVAA